MNNNTPKIEVQPKPMWQPPTGWFKAMCLARDTEAMYQVLVENNANRVARGLPSFEPSYALAEAAIITGRAAYCPQPVIVEAVKLNNP